MNTTTKKTKAAPIKAFWDVIDRNTRLILGRNGVTVQPQSAKRGAAISLTFPARGARTLLQDLAAGGSDPRVVKCKDAPRHRRCWVRRNHSAKSRVEFIVAEKQAGKSERQFLVSLGPTQANRLGRELAAMAERA